MTDDDIRQLVRSAIARHLGPGSAAPPPAAAPPPSAVAPPVPINFARYAIPRAADDVMCIIEPAVRCNGCGYCQCHGH
jgi:hypothetical protein